MSFVGNKFGRSLWLVALALFAAACSSSGEGLSKDAVDGGQDTVADFQEEIPGLQDVLGKDLPESDLTGDAALELIEDVSLDVALEALDGLDLVEDLLEDQGDVACTLFFEDQDQDQYGVGEGVCLPEAEAPFTALQAGDCDDGNVDVHPDREEDCATPADDNCDGVANNEGSLGCVEYYVDEDEDLSGSAALEPVCLCEPAYPHVVTVGGDCDDGRPTVHPEAAETCNGRDDDCDLESDEDGVCPDNAFYCDQDDDGFVALVPTGLCDWADCVPAECQESPGDDCNDGDPFVHPDVLEDCTTPVDDNCNDLLDEVDAANCAVFYADPDEDGFYGAQAESQCRCQASINFSSTQEGDCEPGNALIYPGASEICNGVDDDCDGAVDPIGTCETYQFFCDQDQDGHVSSTPLGSCSTFSCVPSGCRTYPGDDCGDDEPLQNPLMTEDCNTPFDDDCNGRTNEENALNCVAYHRDVDQDGYYADGALVRCRCEPIGLYNSVLPGDCNDDFPSIHPAADEVCNGLDDNCDTTIDGDTVCPLIPYFCDSDLDGVRSSTVSGQCAEYLCVPAVCKTTPGTDCDDTNVDVHPGAGEDCATEQDDDCDGFTNEIDAANCLPFFYDFDRDGYAAADALSRCQCEGAGLYSALTLGDCEDDQIDVHPGALELCNGIDDDCDDVIDSELVCPLLDYFCDQDGDTAVSTTASGSCAAFECIPEECQDTPGTDCNDTTVSIRPGIMDVCNAVDDNCDGNVDEDNACGLTAYYCDVDGDFLFSMTATGACDSFGCVPEGCQEAPGTDCNDDNPDVYPGAAEVCNGQNDNCVAGIDEGGACPLSVFYCDQDQDSFLSKSSSGQCSSYLCVPAGCSTTQGTDCDDGNLTVNPGATEDCETLVDDNCDGALDADNALHCTEWFLDADQDSYYAPLATSVCRCGASGLYSAILGGDCDDSSALVSPSGVESCNGIDDDCDSSVDEGGLCPLLTYYCDSDLDSYYAKTPSGTCSSFHCVPTACRKTQGSDCNDADPLIRPGVQENCLTPADDNCNGLTNELGALNCTLFYEEQDHDGYAPAGAATRCLCGPESGFTAVELGDCADNDATRHPGASELCNGLDDDCDGSLEANELCPELQYYCDQDGDLFVSVQSSGSCQFFDCVPEECDGVPGQDCDDSNFSVRPSALEICNEIDDNCDELVDEGDVCSLTAYYCDADGDLFRSASASGVCAEFGCVPDGCAETAGPDCDDHRADVYPGAAEVCNGADDNCQSGVDEGVCPTLNYFCDADHDGYVAKMASGSCSSYQCVPGACQTTAGDDCNDLSPTVNPGEVEDCLTGVDDDCDGATDATDALNCTTYFDDSDGDGFYANGAQGLCRCFPQEPYDAVLGGDCDDAELSVHPGADEICDGLDDNCDGSADEGDVCSLVVFYCDEDQDGHLSQSVTGTCSAHLCMPAGCSLVPGDDCNDDVAGVHPGVSEDCLTPYDDDCDGSTNAAGALNCSLFHGDTDGDLYGDPDDSSCLCAASGTYVIAHNLATDCDDANPVVHPGAQEICNGADDNCSGAADEGGVCPVVNYYCDLDGDHVISKTASGSCSTYNCLPSSCQTAKGTDCDDANALVAPGLTENCGTTYDDNCNGLTNEQNATGCAAFHADADIDTYGSPALHQCWCAAVAAFPVAAGMATDCNDASAQIHPNAAETCNGIDDDCDGSIDDGSVCPTLTYYCDGDLDGYRSKTASGQCSAFSCLPAGCTTTVGLDCNDALPLVNPGRTEDCSTPYDDNCSGQTDEQNALNCIWFYRDGDLDGFGHLTQKQCWCAANAEYRVLAPLNTDCNDASSLVFPGQTETCNGVDDNCVNGVDEGGICPLLSYYCDSDLDTYRSSTISGSCAAYECVPSACSTTAGNDCDDTKPLVNPGRTENCDTAYDDNCNGSTNAQNALNCLAFYLDADHDGFGHKTASQCWCAASGDYAVKAPLNTDCDDGRAATYPGATDVCNGIDDNCSGAVDEGGVCPVLTYFCDSDEDGYVAKNQSGQCSAYQCIPTGCGGTAGLDCDDTKPLVNPAAAETCATTYDDDCDGVANEKDALNCLSFYTDGDGDGYYGATATSQCWCSASAPYVTRLPGDCDETNIDISPAGTETCNGIDDDCDSLIDEDFCVIADVCYDPGTLSPDDVCLWCDPTISPIGWAFADGQPCDDGLTYTGDDTCQSGACTGTIPECFDTRTFDDSVRLQTLLVGDDGTPGQGLNIDNLLTTCAPKNHCSSGIDNQLSIVDEIVNNELGPQITSGGFNISLEFEGFNTTGTPFQVNMYDANLIATTPACDFTGPGCHYRVSKTWFDSNCEALYHLDNAVVSGSHLTAGGVGSIFGLSLPLTAGIVLTLTVRNAMLDGTVTTDASGNLATFNGVLGGAMIFSELMTTLNLMPEELFPDPPGKAGTIQLVSLLLKPDLDLDLDGVKESVSLGFVVQGNMAVIDYIY